MKINLQDNMAYEVTDLYEYIRETTIQNALTCMSFASNNLNEICGRPHWRTKATKYMRFAKCIIKLSEPHTLHYLLKHATKHFDKNPRHRAYNILYESVCYGTVRTRNQKKSRKFYKYFFGIRIHKRRIGNKIVYVAKVGDICPMGRYIHARVEARERKISITFEKPEDRKVY